MKPVRKRRLIFIGLILLAVSLATTAIVYGVQQNVSYLFLPSQVLAGKARTLQSFRLGGMVQKGSILRHAHSLKVDFIVTDGDATLPVQYTGILPDLFRANQAVIATGHMQGKRFIATEVLAKHDATYMPPSLREAMAKAHRKNNVSVANSGDAQ